MRFDLCARRAHWAIMQMVPGAKMPKLTVRTRTNPVKGHTKISCVLTCCIAQYPAAICARRAHAGYPLRRNRRDSILICSRSTPATYLSSYKNCSTIVLIMYIKNKIKQFILK